MLKIEMETELNDQLNAELYSSYLYLSMSAYFEEKGLSGFAHWMRIQSQEELHHGMKIYDYIVERGGKVTMKPIEGPQVEWDTPVAVFENVYLHEQKVTGLINNLVDVAFELRDHATSNFLQWFVTEQVEEEASASEVLAKSKMLGGEGNALFLLDKELGARLPVFSFPVKN